MLKGVVAMYRTESHHYQLFQSFLKFVFTLASIGALTLSFFLPLTQPASAQSLCFVLPDYETHFVSGVVNSYYPGVANATAGSTSLVLGAGRGSGDSIQPGDLLLVIQMQGSEIDASNSPAYGAGNGSGSGYTNLGGVGLYEYVVADSPLDYQSGGVLNVRGAGVNNGLLFSYTNADDQPERGQQRFQVVRVPAYLNLIFGGNLSASPWDGATGGILALEAANLLDFDGLKADVSGLGFRGGGGRQLEGDLGLNPQDYRTPSAAYANGSKGEGVSGVSRYVLYSGELKDTQPNSGDGYPNGSQARGAPGNAGGGGTDGNPLTNNDNSGGGGGGNGGAGGKGGYSAYSSLDIGGRGGAALAEVGPSRLFLGGGGGAGTNNHGSGALPEGLASSGGAGGGMVFLRAATVVQPGVIYANGASALDVMNDGAGGGGAGGSVLVITKAATPNGLMISARGGAGGNAWRERPGGLDPGDMHGPGGGGGGGVIYTTGSPAAVDIRGGSNGVTTTFRDPYGALPGANGFALSGVSNGAIPGASAGFECFTPTAISLVNLNARPTTAWLSPLWLGAVSLTFLSGSLYLFFQRRRTRLAV